MVSQRSGLHLALALAVALALACNENIVGGADASDGGLDGGDAFSSPCARTPNYSTECWLDGVLNGGMQNQSCPASALTTVTGVVTIPAGTLPVNHARVYIAKLPAPDDPLAPTNLPPIVHGATCDLCGPLVPPDAVVSTSTDVNGAFTLTGVPYPPAGKAMYLVIHTGKWRRYLRLQNSSGSDPSATKLTPCATTTLSKNSTRLPSNQSEGDLPKIALSTGAADALECLLRSPKLGLSDFEFTTEKGHGSVNLYSGNGTDQFSAPFGGEKFTAAQTLPKPSWWDTQANWNAYDLVMLSCEGDPYYSTKSTTARANLQTYLNQGGRVFASHWQNGWIERGPTPLSTVATFVQKPTNPVLGNGTVYMDVVTSSPQGADLQRWLMKASALNAQEQLLVKGAKHTILTLDTRLALPWVTYGTSPLIYQYFSFLAPVGPPTATQCGVMAFTDLHASTGIGDVSIPGPTTAFPDGCKAPGINPQEEALIYLLLELTGCVQPATG